MKDAGKITKTEREHFFLMVAAQALAVLLPIAIGLPAQPATPSQAVKEEAPNNLTEPAPPVQPIPYSHKQHLALGLECQFCHTNPEPRDLMTFPATSTCMTCHATVARNKPSIRKLARFAKTQEPIPWMRVYLVPSYVHWSHGTHLDAGMKCEMCHGQVAQMEIMAKTTIVTSMFGCVDCHEKHNTKTGCNTCHD
jgi:class III cytochrome C family protein